MATRAVIKSKYPPMRPTQAIGSPLPQPSVDVPEPATLTGDWSGKPYVRVGDSPYGREGFQVTPPGGRPPASMANGGSAVVGPTDTPPPPFDPFTDPRWTGNAPMPSDGTDWERIQYGIDHDPHPISHKGLPVENGFAGDPGIFSSPASAPEGFWDMVQRLHSGGTRAQVPGKPASMALGGAGQVGPDYTPDDFANAPQGSSQATSYNQYSQSQQAAPQQTQAQIPTQQPQAPVAGFDPVRDQYNRQQQVFASQNQGVDARAAQTNAQGQVYSATAGTFGPMQNQINANGQVIDAQGRVTGASRALIQNSQADNSARTAEENQLQADARNTPDLQAAAEAQTYRNDLSYKNSAGGVSAAQEYVAPPGDTSQAPAGTLAKIQTKGQVDATAFANADKLRALQLEADKNGVDLLSNDEQGLAEIAAKVGLSVDQARLLVSEASNKADFAGLAVQNADNNTSRAVIQLNQSKNIDPSKVIYQDPITGASRLVSAAEAQTLKAQDERNFQQTQPGDVLYTDPYTGSRSYMSQADADQRKIDYQQQLDAHNLEGNANLGAARGNAQNAAQNAQEIQYAQNPSAPTTPVNWLLRNLTTPTNPGLLSRDQVISALIAHGFTAQQAKDMTEPNTKGGFGSGGAVPGG